MIIYDARGGCRSKRWTNDAEMTRMVSMRTRRTALWLIVVAILIGAVIAAVVLAPGGGGGTGGGY
jgi:hypothetical protein